MSEVTINQNESQEKSCEKTQSLEFQEHFKFCYDLLKTTGFKDELHQKCSKLVPYPAICSPSTIKVYCHYITAGKWEKFKPETQNYFTTLITEQLILLLRERQTSNSFAFEEKIQALEEKKQALKQEQSNGFSVYETAINELSIISKTFTNVRQ